MHYHIQRTFWLAVILIDGVAMSSFGYTFLFPHPPKNVSNIVYDAISNINLCLNDIRNDLNIIDTATRYIYKCSLSSTQFPNKT